MQITTKRDAGPGNERGIGVDDHIYFHHPEHGAQTGKVASVGKHGCQVHHELAEKGGLLEVKWGQVLGYKQRKQKQIKLVDSGEDGHIGLDENGKRIFIAGKLPEVSMTKALSADELAANAQTMQAEVDAALLKAGYDPGIDYIRKTYGEHWSKNNG